MFYTIVQLGLDFLYKILQIIIDITYYFILRVILKYLY